LGGRPLAPERYEIMALANNYRDESAAFVHRFALRHPALALHIVELTLPAIQANVGRAPLADGRG